MTADTEKTTGGSSFWHHSTPNDKIKTSKLPIHHLLIEIPLQHLFSNSHPFLGNRHHPLLCLISVGIVSLPAVIDNCRSVLPRSIKCEKWPPTVFEEIGKVIFYSSCSLPISFFKLIRVGNGRCWVAFKIPCGNLGSKEFMVLLLDGLLISWGSQMGFLLFWIQLFCQVILWWAKLNRGDRTEMVNTMNKNVKTGRELNLEWKFVDVVI